MQQRRRQLKEPEEPKEAKQQSPTHRMHLAAAQRGVNEISKETCRCGRGRRVGEKTRAVTLNANCLCGAFLLLFFHFSYFVVGLVIVAYFLAPKPKNPNEAKRMSAVRGRKRQREWRKEEGTLLSLDICVT